ncbi:MAG: LytTR family DNA-binding domain-containing protein [Flavobacteriales bacterium]|nr:LytTR family DNA-binding domain-containing protein [Flavobacteriales bacterium]
MMRAIIVEDEAAATEILVRFLRLYCPNIELIGKATTGEEAIEMINNNAPDLVFLDVRLGEMSGFDVLNTINTPTPLVIFTTAFNDFAIQAIRHSAIDYLQKPINPAELMGAVLRAQTRFDEIASSRLTAEALRVQQAVKTAGRIAVSTYDGQVVLKLQDIVRLEADSNYTNFHMKDGNRVMASKGLKEYEEQLPRHHFFRTHQSHIVNLNYVISLMKEDGGYILMEDGTQIYIARRRKDEFLAALAGSPAKVNKKNKQDQ